MTEDTRTYPPDHEVVVHPVARPVKKSSSKSMVKKVAVGALLAVGADFVAATFLGLTIFGGIVPIVMALIIYGVLSIALCAVVIKVIQLSKRIPSQKGF